MRQVKTGDKVKVHYTGKLPDGTVFDSSRDREALEVTVGSGSVIRGIEDALVGMSVGDTKELEVGPDDAYGQRRKELVLRVGMDKFPPDAAPREGMVLKLVGPDEQAVPGVILEVLEDYVTVDANHPLSGKDLIFQIELAEIE